MRVTDKMFYGFIKEFMKQNENSKAVKAIEFSNENTLCEADYSLTDGVITITAVRPLATRRERDLDGFLFLKKKLLALVLTEFEFVTKFTDYINQNNSVLIDKLDKDIGDFDSYSKKKKAIDYSSYFNGEYEKEIKAFLLTV